MAALLFATTHAVAVLPTPNPVPGGIAIVRVGDARAPAPVVMSENARTWVTQRGDDWVALVGIPLSAKVGVHPLEVRDANTAKGNINATRAAQFAVKPKKYPTQKLKITNRAMVDPPPEVMARIERESKHLAGVRSTFRESDTTDARFNLPAKGPLSSKFGLARVLNGKPRAPHAGLDVAVPTGTAVVAPADGVLIDADDYYYCGKTAFVDHGNGLISMHCHLSEFDAHPGTPVLRGQLIGRSGATGRVTGPHLHWSVYLNGTSVDPALFLAKPHGVGR